MQPLHLQGGDVTAGAAGLPAVRRCWAFKYLDSACESAEYKKTCSVFFFFIHFAFESHSESLPPRPRTDAGLNPSLEISALRPFDFSPLRDSCIPSFSFLSSSAIPPSCHSDPSLNVRERCCVQFARRHRAGLSHRPLWTRRRARFTGK